MIRRHSAPVQVLLALVLLTAACTGASTAEDAADDAADDGPVVVATTTILGDVAAQLVGSDGEVRVIMGRGVDPHEYLPSAAEVEQLREADMVLANGLGFEEGLTDAINSAEEDGVGVLRATDVIDVVEVGGDPDPHFWHDPTRMAAVVQALADRLAELDEGDGIDWAGRGEDIAADLTALDAEVHDILAPIPVEDRVIVTNHESLAYLADRYDLEVVDTVIPGTSTLAESSAADLEELVATIEAHEVGAIFTDESSSSSLAEAVAAEAGTDVDVVALHSESLGEPDGPAGTYAGLLRSNAMRIAEALTR